MVVPPLVWIIFLFLLGACTGSFLNVVVWRLPRGESLISPPSHCTSCGKAIRWYDNIPIFSWFILRGKCRNCGAGFSIRYCLTELFTAIMFVGLYWAYFILQVRSLLPGFEHGGWVVYAGSIYLLCMLLVSAMIDAQYWIIPLSVTYSAVIVGLILGAISPVILPVDGSELWFLVPYASPKIAAGASGAVLGLLTGLLMIKIGVIKRSFADWEAQQAELGKDEVDNITAGDFDNADINIRLEMLREIVFLLPAVLLGLGFMWLAGGQTNLAQWWAGIIENHKWLAGLLGSVFGYIIGAAVVWATRILGSLAFGREAMGLGDVHLMAAVGAILGWVCPILAFFIAPFFGLGWAIVRLITQGKREIPYGPFLALGTLVVMFLHDPLINYFRQAWQVR